MPTSKIPRGLRMLPCQCYVLKTKGKVYAVLTCKDHQMRLVPALPRKLTRRVRKMPLD